jgi:hypothetical protein
VCRYGCCRSSPPDGASHTRRSSILAWCNPVAAGAELVSQAVAALVASTKDHERGLPGEWDRDDVDTEGLRNALRSYRDLLNRLVRL